MRMFQKFSETISTVFAKAIVADQDLQDSITVACGISGLHQLGGGIGLGKTQLMETLAKVFGTKAVVINMNESVRPPDILNWPDIQQETVKSGDTRTGTFKFGVRPKGLLTEPWVYINEINRAAGDVHNSLMSIFSEGGITLEGQRFQRPRGIIWLDYNPYLAKPMDRAFMDRIDTSTMVESLDMSLQHQLMLRKFSGGGVVKSMSDLVAPMMTMSDLYQVWDEVERVEFPQGLYPMAQVVLGVFRNCIHGDLSSANQDWMDSKLNDCDACRYKASCLMSRLTRPVLERALTPFVQACKSNAYRRGAVKVEASHDFVPALCLTMMHRVDVRPEVSMKFRNTKEWLRDEVRPFLTARSVFWNKARETYQEINKALKDGEMGQAVALYDTYIAESDDVNGLKFVQDFAKKKLEASREKAAEDLAAVIMKMVDGTESFDEAKLTATEKMVANTPEDHSEKPKAAMAKLGFLLKSSARTNEWARTLVAMSKLDSDARANLANPYSGQRANLDGATINIIEVDDKGSVEFSWVVTSSTWLPFVRDILSRNDRKR